jgi:hypothetical protein
MCLTLVHADLEVTGIVAQFRVPAALQGHEHRSNDHTRASARFGRCISKYMLHLHENLTLGLGQLVCREQTIKKF